MRLKDDRALVWLLARDVGMTPAGAFWTRTAYKDGRNVLDDPDGVWMLYGREGCYPTERTGEAAAELAADTRKRLRWRCPDCSTAELFVALDVLAEARRRGPVGQWRRLNVVVSRYLDGGTPGPLWSHAMGSLLAGDDRAARATSVTVSPASFAFISQAAHEAEIVEELGPIGGLFGWAWWERLIQDRIDQQDRART